MVLYEEVLVIRTYSLILLMLVNVSLTGISFGVYLSIMQLTGLFKLFQCRGYILDIGRSLCDTLSLFFYVFECSQVLIVSDAHVNCEDYVDLFAGLFVGTAAAIVIFVGHMSVIAGLWPVHVVHTYNTIARQVSIIVIYFEDC